jgi:hypothetical protein
MEPSGWNVAVPVGQALWNGAAGTQPCRLHDGRFGLRTKKAAFCDKGVTIQLS